MTHDRPESLIAQLSQDAKAMEARMLPEFQNLTPDQIDRVRVDLKHLMEQQGLSARDVADATNGVYKHGAVSTFLSEGRVGDKFVRFIARWMEQRRGLALEGAPVGLVATKVADEILGVYYNALSSMSMAIITGPSGCGKTSVAKAAAYELIPGTLHFEIPSVVHTGNQLLRFLGRHLKIRGFSSPEMALGGLIEHFSGSKRLLIFDECHFLQQAGLLVLRDLHKATGCPIVLQGTSTLVDTLEDLKGFSGQFRRLISYVYEADHERSGAGGQDPLFTTDDVAKYVKSMGLRLVGGSLSLATELANVLDWGGLGKLTILLLNCSKIKADEPIDEQTMRSVLREMEGVRITQRVTLQIDRARNRKEAVA